MNHQQKSALILPLLLLIVAFIPAVVYAIPPLTITPPTDDAYASSNPGFEDTNYGTDTFIQVQAPSVEYQGFVKFSLSGIPPGSTIISAYLKLCFTAVNSDPTVAAHRVTGPWDETTLTWNNKPSFISTPSDSVVKPSLGYYSWDVTTDVQLFVSNSATNHGWCLTQTAGWSTVGSKEASAAATHPILEVTYVPGNVVPEYAFGALLGLVGCFAAFVIIKKPHLNLRIR